MNDQQDDQILNDNRGYRRGRAVRIGEVITKVLENTILQQDSLAAVSDSWTEVMPAGMVSHCRLAGLSRGILQVEAESALYASELHLYRAELLRELRRRCPRARITAIKLAVAGDEWV